MRFTTIVAVVAALATVVLADTRRYSRDNDESDEHLEVPRYEYAWGVKDDDSGNMFNQVESRDADTTRGAYYVALPDGRLQKVTYYVDGDSGFVAEVTYEGEATYPDQSDEDRRQYG